MGGPKLVVKDLRKIAANLLTNWIWRQKQSPQITILKTSLDTWNLNSKNRVETRLQNSIIAKTLFREL